MQAVRNHPLQKAFIAALAAILGLAWLARAGEGGGAPRTFRTFLPKSSDVIQEPETQVIQLLLDRQEKEDCESYMVQVLFRGKPPAEHTLRTYPDRIEIDFLDTGKPSMRLAKIRGGVLEASSLEELCYREPNRPAQGRPRPRPVIKRMVRLTLFMHEKTEMKLRDTLDRTLIHFRVPKPSAGVD